MGPVKERRRASSRATGAAAGRKAPTGPSEIGGPPQKPAAFDLEKAARQYLLYVKNPVKYVEQIILGQRPEKIEPYQADVLDMIAEHNRVAIKAANGVGKDTLAAWMMEWYLLTRPMSKIPSTSGVFRQVRSMLWSEVHQWTRKSMAYPHIRLLTTRMEVVGYEGEWFAEGFTARDEEDAEGYHAKHLLYVVTEARAVPDKIWTAILKACTGEENKVFAQSIPGGEVGEFFRIFSQYRSTWATYSFAAAKPQTNSKGRVEYLSTCKLVSQHSIDEKLAKGEDSPIFQAGVMANFLKQTSESLIPLMDVENAQTEERLQDLALAQEHGTVEMGIDVARFGDDATVFAFRKGPVVYQEMPEYWKQDIMESTGRAVHYIRKYRPARVKVDVIGLGSGLADRLRELEKEAKMKRNQAETALKEKKGDESGHQKDIDDAMAHVVIVDVNVSEAAASREQYRNQRDEGWDTLASRLKDGQIALPDDPELATEMTAPKFRYSSGGKKEVESKQSVKGRGYNSPNKTDAIILAFSLGKAVGLNIFF